MKYAWRAALALPAVMLLFACSTPTDTRLPPDGEPPKEPPPDDVSFAPVVEQVMFYV